MRLSFWLCLPALVGAFSLLFTGCGGDDDATPTPTVGSPTPTQSVPPGTAGPGVTDTEIHLGMTNDVSGAGETPYAAVSMALHAYFQKVNQEDGGVCGRQIVLTVKDDEYSPELALSLTEELVEEDEVLAVIGALSTQAHMEVAAYLNDPNGNTATSDGIPDLFVSTGWSGWGDTATYPWTTGFIPDYLSDGRALAEYARTALEADTVALLYRNDEFGQDYLAALEEVFPEEGALFSQPYPEDDDGVGEEMGAVIEFGADVVVLAAPPEISAAAIAAAHDDDYEPQFLLSYINQPSNLASSLGGGTAAEDIIQGFMELDGVLLSTYLLSAVENENNTAVVEHVGIMETYGGPAASSLSIYAQALGETVAEVLSRACPNITRDDLMEAAESLDGFHPTLLLPGIDVTLSEDDHLAIQALQIVRINGDGTLESLGEPIDTGP